jgi:hypothetical protein
LAVVFWLAIQLRQHEPATRAAADRLNRRGIAAASGKQRHAMQMLRAH